MTRLSTIRGRLISSAEPHFLHASPLKILISNLDLHWDCDPDILVSSLRGHLRLKIEPGQDSHNVATNHKALFFEDVRLFGVLSPGKYLHQKDLDFLRVFLQLINYDTLKVISNNISKWKNYDNSGALFIKKITVVKCPGITFLVPNNRD